MDDANKQGDAATAITFGSIRKMQLPSGWIDVSDSLRSSGARNVHRFEPLLSDGASLTFILDHCPITAQTRQALGQVLTSEPHQLNNDELAGLVGVIDELSKPDQFKMEDVCTLDWNGRRCVGLSGSSTETDARSMLFYFLSGDDMSRREQVSFTAPSALFSEYKQVVMSCFKTIQWDAGYLPRP